MGFHLEIPPVPPSGDGRELATYLRIQRELLIRLIKHVNDIGCGLKFNSDNRLAVNHNGKTLVCCTDVGLEAVSFVGMVKGSHKDHSHMMIAAGVID